MNFTLPYVVASLIVGVCGINRKLGFWGYFFSSLVLTPAVGIILVACSDRRKDI